MRGALLAISSVGMGPPRSQPARPVDSLSRTAALGRPITSASFLGACDLPGRRAGSHSCRARLRASARGGRRGVRGGVPPEPMRAPPAPDAQSRRPCPPRLIALKDSDGKARRRWGTEVQAVGSRLSGPPDFTYDHPRKAQTNKRVLHWIVDGAVRVVRHQHRTIGMRPGMRLLSRLELLTDISRRDGVQQRLLGCLELLSRVGRRGGVIPGILLPPMLKHWQCLTWADHKRGVRRMFEPSLA